MAKDIESKLDSTKKQSRRQKATIIGLSVALLLVAGAAITVPLVLVNKQKQGQTVYTVTFDGNGADQTIDAQEIVAGNKVTQPIVSKNNYTLKGWFTDGPSGTNQWDFNTVVKSNMKLTAQWVELPPVVVVKTITYVGNGGQFIKGSETTDSITTNIVQGKTFGSVSPEVMPTKANSSFTGWFTDQECKNPVNNNTTINDNFIVYAGYISELQTSTIQFITGENEKIVGRSTLDVEKTKTWKDVKELQPFAKKDGYTFQHWSLSKDDPSIEVPDNTPFTNNTALYPCFELIPTPSKACTIHFNAEGGQLQGSDKLTVALPETGTTTWGSIPKPGATKEGYTFSCWATKTDSTYTPISDTYDLPEGSLEVYAVFDAEITAPIIRFTNPDEPTEPGKNYVWVGNPEFRAEASEEGTLWSSVPKPQVYKDADGSWNTGFVTDYYFYNWSLSPDQDPSKIVHVPERITEKELVVYPVFKQKSSITFNEPDGIGGYSPIASTTSVPNPVKAAETEVWGKIVKPTPKERSGEYFIGWIGKFTKDGDYLPISDSTTVSSLYDLTDIRAEFSNECNYIEFLTDAVYDDGTSAGTVDYWGVKKVGISKIDATYWSRINKPAIVTKDESGTDNGKVFLRWEINMGTDEEPNWKTISDTTKTPLPAREDRPYKVRPVIEQKYEMIFNSGAGKFEEAGSTGAELTYKVSSSTKFEDMPKPTVIAPTESGINYIFRCWALDEQGNKPVPNGHVFKENEKIYAIFDKPTISSVVNYKLTQKQIEAGAKITANSRVAFNHLRSETISFGQIAKAETEYLGHEVSFWTTSDSEDETEASEGMYTSDKALPNSEITLYPFFKETTNYKKVVVQEGDWTIKSGATLYIKIGDKMLSGITTEVEWGSRELLGWEQSVDDGATWKSITASTVMESVDNTIIRPIFSAPILKRVELSNNGNSLIKMTCKQWEVEYGTKVTELYKDQIGDNAPVWEGSEFVEWQILNADGTFTSITDDMKVESNLILVPKFTGQSEFYETNLAYFFDDRVGKKAWAGIIDYTGPNLTIKYARDSTLYTFPKSEFNFELKFGTLFKQIPDYFMMGCVNYNNGGKELIIPKGVTSIGKCFLRGCSSFNQKIDLSGCVKTQVFEVGEQFMAGCYSFNQDIDFSFIGDEYGLYIKGCGAFMFDCQQFTSKVIFPTHVGFESTDPSEPSETPDAYSLATTNKYAPMYTTGVKTNSKIFTASTTSPYRMTLVI